MADYHVSEDPAWQPYRDAAGNVVTVTPDQCAAIRHALRLYADVVNAERAKGTNSHPAVTPGQLIQALDATHLIGKSRLMGRLLYEGKAPLVDAPPLAMSGPDYSVEEPRG